MADAVERVIHIWCEDRGHESVITTLVRRILRDLEFAPVRIEVKNGEGGSARVISEFKSWQRAMLKGGLGERPDVLVLIVDANGHGHVARRRELREIITDGLFPHVVIGCPDPHVEAWLMLDTKAFESVTGSALLATRPRGSEDYKGWFHACVAESGVPVLTGPMELAPDLIEGMDLDAASERDRSLSTFLDELRSTLRLLRSAG